MLSFPAVLSVLSERTGVMFRRLANGEWQGACPVCEPFGKGHHLYLKPGTKSAVVLYCQRG